MSDQPLLLVCWIVELDDHSCVTFAITAKAAQWNAVASAREAGFYSRKQWPMHCKARRAERYDNSHLKENCGRRVWSEDFVITA